MAFRAAMKDATLDAKYGLRRGYAAHKAKARRLGWTNDLLFEEVFSTTDPLANVSTTPAPCELGVYAGLYDMIAYHKALPISIDSECPGSELKWDIVDGKYCSNKNMPSIYTTIPQISKAACYNKCAPPVGGHGNESDVIVDGVNDWCSGYSVDFTGDTDALCIPREECEALCILAGDACSSIDMHRFLPRCYLNAKDACGPFNTTTGAPSDLDSSEDYDVIYPTVTMEEEVSATDGARDVYVTYTGKAMPAGCLGSYETGSFVASTSISINSRESGRKQCEAMCSADMTCIGFQFETLDSATPSESCTLARTAVYDLGGGVMTRCIGIAAEPYIAAPPGDRLSHVQTVMKENPGRCYVDVMAAVEVEEMANITIPGTYMKTLAGEVYLKTDNTTRLKYVPGVTGDAAKPCDSWSLQKNLKPLTEVVLKNCTDNPPLAAYFLKVFHAQGPLQTRTYVNSQGIREPLDAGAPDAVLEGTQYPCQWGADEGWCHDKVFWGLCAHTCTRFETVVINEEAYNYQFEDGVPMTLYRNATYDYGISHSTCDGDNNYAAYSWYMDYSFGDPMKRTRIDRKNLREYTACRDIASSNFTDHAMKWTFCDEVDTLGFLKHFCKITCPSYPTGAPNPNSTYVDEVHAIGSQYGSPYVYFRRLDETTEEHTWFEDRKLQVSGYTTSSAGMPASVMTVAYLDGSDSLDFETLLKTSGAGAHMEHMPYGGADLMNMTVVNGTGCQVGAPTGSQMALDLLEMASLYNIDVPFDPTASLDYVCRGVELCPEFTTCVLSPIRFEDELSLAFGKGWAGAGPDLDGVNTKAKVLVTDYRGTAIISALKVDLNSMVMRSAMGSTRATLKSVMSTEPEKAIESVVMSLVSPTAAMGYYAETEYLTTYPENTGTLGYLSDVLRFEAFAEDKSYVPAMATIDMYIGPVARPDLLRVVMIPYGGTPVLVDYVSTPGGVQFTAPVTAADFYITATVDACMEANPCDAKATCTNTPEGVFQILEPTCTCDPMYSGDGLTCALKPEFYNQEAGTLDFYVKISHMDVMDFGWRVKEIELYSDFDCTQSISFSSAKLPFPGVPGTSTYDVITSKSDVYTGEFGYSHYPAPTDLISSGGKGASLFKYGNENLFDGDYSSASGEWWSECLNCNPMTPATIEFMLKGDTTLGCIKVVQDAQHFSKSIKFEKGFISGEECGMMPGMKRCEPFSVWTATGGKPAGGTDAVVRVNTTCGTANQQIFGEIMLVAGTSWEGSYANNHPVESACHCHMLCVAHLDQGCRSFKFFEEIDGKDVFRHCYLQSNIFSSGNGFYGTSSSKNPAIATGWTSGTPALRYTKNGKLMDMPYLFSMSTDPPLMEALDAGETFTITVEGAGMPYSEAKSLDASDLQRIKLVYADDGCEAMVPKEVTGISCIESVKSVPLLAGPVDTKIYTFCGPRPTTASPDAISFDGIKITQTSEETSYKVCYCAFDCFEPSRWQVVPELLTVPGSVFVWETSPETILRKTDTNEFDVTVTRPSFGSHTAAAGWELKIIRDFYDCDVDMDPSIFGVSGPLTAPECTGPDVCTWTYTLTAGLSEVGKYLACFRQKSEDPFTAIPSSMGEKFIVIEKLAADYIHPRGIFHNQLFSVLAGGEPLDVELAGTRMAVPTMGAITLTKGSCADPSTYSFPAEVMPMEVMDSTPPTLLMASPATGAEDATLLLEFSEPVTRGEACFGANPPSIILRSSGAPVVITCDSPQLVLQRNKVLIVPSTPLAADTYFYEIETSTFVDLAGNPVMLTLTNGLYEVTISTGAESETPAVLLSFPADGANDYNATAGIDLYFSEEVTAAPGAGGNFSLGIVKCGAVCLKSDPVLYTPALTLMTGTGTAKLSITEAEGSFVLDNMGRYKITLPKNSLQDGAGNTGPVDDFVFEFVKGAETEFASKVFRALPTSTAGKLDFSVALSPDTEPGTYSVCYCSGQMDGNLALLGDFGYTYELTEDKDCSGTPVLDYNTTDTLIMGLSLEDHVCSVKCDKGCIGPHCYCDGYTADATSDTLCLPKTLCAEACSAVSSPDGSGLKSGGCKGIVVHDILPTCVLLADTCTDPTAEEIFQYFERKDGTACTNFGDFSETAGAAVVTSRVHVDVDFIFKPATPGSIEVTATETGMLLGEGLSQTTAVTDRITIIDCGGTCGISSPTKSLALPLNADSIAMWNEFVPYTVYEDPPHIDVENPQSPLSTPPTMATTLPAEYYTTFPDESDPAVGYYVKGHNLDAPGKMVPFDGDMRSLEEFQCFHKCSEGCSGDSCYCDGYFAGYDTETSTALCADQTLCQYLCDQLGRAGCMSIDMHTELPRCFLNDASADTTPAALMMDPSYKVLVKREFMDNNFEYPTTVTEATGGATGEEEGAILSVVDYGYSFAKMLRFKDIQFKSGGTFKLCFCDSSLISGPCKTEADYSVQVGTIHSSGVQCLISKPELQRASCVPTYFGGGSSLRCYKSPMEAPMPKPPTIGEITRLAGLSGTPSELADAGLSTACAYGAEEGGCPTVGEAQGASPPRKRA
jgi:hypothetical protein